MYQRINSCKTQPEKAMTEEQFAQIVDAIILGRYSWACLLILRFAGYNPLHYIPYRTYNRLIKNNYSNIIDRTAKTKCKKQSVKLNQKHQHESKLRDLPYLEEIEHQSIDLKGGSCKTISLRFMRS